MGFCIPCVFVSDCFLLGNFTGVPIMCPQNCSLKCCSATIRSKIYPCPPYINSRRIDFHSSPPREAVAISLPLLLEAQNLSPTHPLIELPPTKIHSSPQRIDAGKGVIPLFLSDPLAESMGSPHKPLFCDVAMWPCSTSTQFSVCLPAGRTFCSPSLSAFALRNSRA